MRSPPRDRRGGRRWWLSPSAPKWPGWAETWRALLAHRAGFGHQQIDLPRETQLEDDPDVIAVTLGRIEPMLASFRARVKAIAELCRRHAIEPVFVTQPGLYGDAIDPATGVNLAGVQANGTANGKLWWRVQELYNDVTRQVAADEGALVVDGARLLPKDSRLFYDYIHFTNEGAARFGDLVAAGLEPRLRTLAPPPHRPE